VLTEDRRGRLDLWTFHLPNVALPGPLENFLVKTDDAEQDVGGQFWDRVSDEDLRTAKSRPGKMW